MDIEIEVPGTGHGRLRFTGGWPGLDELADLADALAESTRRCPHCDDVPAEEFLLAMASVAPANLATCLRQLAGAEPEPSPAERALAASYERYAGELAAIEKARAAWPCRPGR